MNFYEYIRISMNICNILFYLLGLKFIYLFISKIVDLGIFCSNEIYLFYIFAWVV